MRERTGSVWWNTKKIDGKSVRVKDARGREMVYARVTFFDSDGRRRDIKRRARSESHARTLIRSILNEIDAVGERAIDAARLTFSGLAKYYEENYLTVAQYVEGRKVSGVRSPGTWKNLLKPLKEHFGLRLVRSISTGDVERFKRIRLAAPVLRGTDNAGNPIERQRAVASVNRELSLLRRLFSVAHAEGWIIRNPCHAAHALISPSDEVRRTRILSRDDEARLLAACGDRPQSYMRGGKTVVSVDSGARRTHLRAAIICALDTGMRHGEILALRWRDIDMDARTIRVLAYNTKTQTERSVGITDRLAAELVRLRKAAAGEDALVFGVKGTVKRGFRRAADAAGLSDVRFHDLRHTAATRLVRMHMPIAEVARVLGHSDIRTTFRYVNPDASVSARAATMLDEYTD